MFTLKADNRTISNGAKFTFIKENYSSGVTSIVVDNSTPIVALDYILIGEWGEEFTEIVKVSTVTSSSHTLALTAATSFAHSESSRVTVIKYNQVKFYRTATTTFSEAGTLLATIDIQPERFHTVYNDTTNTTGYGWFKFYNATLGVATTNSNAIPYAGFARNSVKKMIDRFFSLLNNKEMKMITFDDAFDFLNEGYVKARSHLNLVNQEYSVDPVTTISAVAGTSEYDLPSNFFNLIVINDSNGYEIEYISLRDMPYHNSNAGNEVRYYMRGTKIGFSPTPAVAATYKIYNTTLPAELTSYYDNIEFPNLNYHSLLNFMLYKAKLKAGDSNDAAKFFTLWTDDLNLMKSTSIKQSANQDTWGIHDRANI